MVVAIQLLRLWPPLPLSLWLLPSLSLWSKWCLWSLSSLLPPSLLPPSLSLKPLLLLPRPLPLRRSPPLERLLTKRTVPSSPQTVKHPLGLFNE